MSGNFYFQIQMCPNRNYQMLKSYEHFILTFIKLSLEGCYNPTGVLHIYIIIEYSRASNQLNLHRLTIDIFLLSYWNKNYRCCRCSQLLDNLLSAISREALKKILVLSSVSWESKESLAIKSIVEVLKKLTCFLMVHIYCFYWNKKTYLANYAFSGVADKYVIR